MKPLTLLAAAMTVAGCGMMPAKPMMVTMAAPPPPPAPTPMVLPSMPEMLMPRPGLAARERFQLAVSLLTQGDAPHAEAELKAYLMEVPNSGPARSLLSQIETPIEQLYPADSFTVMVGSNETMSQIAGVYLGDALAFYGLSRYNNIANPSRISQGQPIRIPKTQAALSAQIQHADMMMPMAGMMTGMTPTMPLEPTPASVTPPRGVSPLRPADPWLSINTDVAAGRFAAAIRTAETARVMPNAMQAGVLANAYSANAKAVRAANATEAETQAVRAGQLYLDPANRPEDAIAPLSLALEINPADSQADTLLGLARTRAADSYYRSGLVAFQRQDLDGAIAAWDKALTIDPGHKNAQLNRAQAVELKANLQRINPGAK